jgi:hypothetical protein
VSTLSLRRLSAYRLDLASQPGGGRFTGAGLDVGTRACRRGGAPFGLFDSLLSGLGLGLDLGQAALGARDRAVLGDAFALQLRGVLPAQLLQRFGAGLALLLQVDFERPDLRGGSLLRCHRGVHRLSQPPFGCLDLGAGRVVVGVALLLAHRQPNLLLAAVLADEHAVVGGERALGHSRRRQRGRAGGADDPRVGCCQMRQHGFAPRGGIE